MRALWLAQGTLTPTRFQLPDPGPGECVVKVIQAGICGTDLALRDGLYDFQGIPGHEFVGEVVQGPPSLLGKRVVADINLSCGRCSACERCESRHCRERRVLGIRDAHGAFAERIIVPERNLFTVSDRLADDHAVFAEPLAAALAVRDEVSVSGDGRALVMGAGRLGQLMVRVLARAKWQVHCHGRGAAALNRLPTGIVCSHGGAPTSAGFDLVVDTSGSESGLALAVAAVRPRGTLVLKSTLAGRPRVDLNRVVVDEIRLLGSRCGSIPRALRWLESEQHDLDALITHRYALERGGEAFATSADSTSCKVILAP